MASLAQAQYPCIPRLYLFSTDSSGKIKINPDLARIQFFYDQNNTSSYKKIAQLVKISEILESDPTHKYFSLSYIAGELNLTENDVVKLLKGNTRIVASYIKTLDGDLVLFSKSVMSQLKDWINAFQYYCYLKY